MPEMTPREIVHELDKHIIGQTEAKRAVAIALRNRWRRTQVSEVLQQCLLVTELPRQSRLVPGKPGKHLLESVERGGRMDV